MKLKPLRRSQIISLSLLIFVAIGAAFSPIDRVNGKEINQSDILIIYSSGTPFKTISEVKPKEIDTVTSPTPKLWNCKMIAERLTFVLRSKGFAVRLAEASEIKHYDEIFRARLVVIGSPAYFSNVSWQIKRLLDQQFSKIYVIKKERLAKKRIAAFSMAEWDGSANAALKAIKEVVSDGKGLFGPTMNFITNHHRKEMEKRINRFAKELELAIKR
jgi:flavorubredoxin